MVNQKQRQRARQKRKKISSNQCIAVIEDKKIDTRFYITTIYTGILNFDDDVLTIIINYLSLSNLYKILIVCKDLNLSIKRLWNSNRLIQRNIEHHDWYEHVTFNIFMYFTIRRKIPFSNIKINKNRYEIIERKKNSIKCKRVKTYNSEMSLTEILLIPLNILFKASQKIVSCQLDISDQIINIECQIDQDYPKLPLELRNNNDMNIYDQTFMFNFLFNLGPIHYNTNKLVTTLRFDNLIPYPIRKSQYITIDNLILILCEYITPFKNITKERVTKICCLYFDKYKR